MSAKKRRAARAAAPAASDSRTPGGPDAPEPTGSIPRSQLDRRPLIYAVFDVVFASIYLVIARKLVPSANGHFELASWLAVAGVTAAGAGTVMRRPSGWWMAVAGCVTVLGFCVVLISLLLMSAAFLRGVYGALGKGASMACLMSAAIAVEVYGILPAFQLKYLLSADGRRTAGRR